MKTFNCVMDDKQSYFSCMTLTLPVCTKLYIELRADYFSLGARGADTEAAPVKLL